MENPVNTIKANLSVSKILGFVIVGVVVLGILDAAGLTNYFLYPYSAVKAKFFPGKTA